jgi:hypothetical protein
MRTAAICTVLSGALSFGLAACGGDDDDDAPAIDAGGDPDATPAPPWWQPRSGEASNWDIQLAAPFDVSAERVMYVLSLWDLVPEEIELDYGDGDPVTVPAGVLAGTIADLHGRSPAAIVLCHLDTGALELGRPDAAKFPGFEADPPDRPDPPAPGSVIGWSASGHPDERYLDIGEVARPELAGLIWKRLDLAAQIGCDGVATDRNDVITRDPGFDISTEEQVTWFREVADQAHARELAVGMKDGDTIPGHIDQLADAFDFLTVQRCAEFQSCDTTRPFTILDKAVFAIDYELDGELGEPQNPDILCPRQLEALVFDGLVKDAELTSGFRVQCGESD